MLTKPASLTAATGIDALTHTIEAFVSTAKIPTIDTVAVKTIELIQVNLRKAIAHGDNLDARDQMA